MKTGWPAILMQDDCKKLSQWFASRMDARRVVRAVCAEIRANLKQAASGNQPESDAAK